MRALVTGCAGFIGSHLVDSLLADGHEVVGVDSLSDNYDVHRKLRNLRDALDYDGFRFETLDCASSDLGRALDGVESVFHLAAESGVRPSWGRRFEHYARNNIVATQRVLEAARAAGARRAVYASSSSVYGQARDL